MNDNCPILNETSWSIEPVPALQIDPVVVLSATDRDSGLNGEIQYLSALPTVR